MQKFKIIGKPLLGEKYVEGKKEEERKNNAKFSGHYVRPRTHAQRLCAHTPIGPKMGLILGPPGSFVFAIFAPK